MSDLNKVLEMIKENDARYVDFRFTDPRGKWHHLARHVSSVDKDSLSKGVMFDGSSVPGWAANDRSDLALVPDPSSAVMDPFSAQPQLILICDVHQAGTGQAYARDPRSCAGRAEAHLKTTGIGDAAYFGLMAAFFVFDDVGFEVSANHSFFRLGAEEGPSHAGDGLVDGRTGHRPATGGGYVPVPPVDQGMDLRAEMGTVMTEMGLKIEQHHHEVAACQHRLGLRRATLLRGADNMQIYKYCVQMVAHSYGKTATFMPKPVMDEAGSGLDCHQSIWKAGKPTFAGKGAADLSQAALFYIGGLVKHAAAISAFANPTTNSYKRLVPDLEAPILLAYSARNRSAACAMPRAAGPEGRRVVLRTPDPSANPYLACAAMLMAGLDGIENKTRPGEPMDKSLYDLSPEELDEMPTVCGSLPEALEALDADREFLKAGQVFSDDLIDAYLELKWDEVSRLERTPHPVEYALYYSV
ncbi:MAG: type I glutamate--ammonia ligase [Kiloniellales bacterium]